MMAVTVANAFTGSLVIEVDEAFCESEVDDDGADDEDNDVAPVETGAPFVAARG